MQEHPFKVIGIGAAFSPTLKANLSEASRLCLLFDAKLILIHVGQVTDEKTKKLSDIIAPFKAKGLKYNIVFQPGEPVQSILDVTQLHQIDLLILGAVQRENFVKYYVGSIARKITRKAPCSILLLIKPSIDRVPCEHIVVNGLEAPRTQQTIEASFFIAHKLAAARITIVEEIRQQEVVFKADDDKSIRQVALQKEKLRRREEVRVHQILSHIPDRYKKDLSVTTQPIFGKRGYSIGHYAEVVRSDLLVMNAPKIGNFWDRLFPHDIEHILTELPTDVLIIQ